MTTTELSELKAFMEAIPGVAVVEADDPEAGKIGYYAFYQQDNQAEEVGIWIAAKVCRQVNWIEGTDEFGVLARSEIQARLREAMRGRWCCCDDAKKRLMGFMCPRHGKPSEAFMVRLDDVKSLPKPFLNRLFAWRKKHQDFRATAILSGYLIVEDEP